MIGWHFATKEEILAYGDGRKRQIGVTHTVEPPIKLCERGLHASERLIDALGYAPGPILYRVKLSGDILLGDDKSVATERTDLNRIDLTDTLDQFKRACALSVVHLWDAPEVVMRFLLGDNHCRADARDAAWAAESAAASAAWAAARAAAEATDRANPWDAAGAAAGDAALAATKAEPLAAARAAARASARAAALASDRATLKDAALASARAAALAAAWAAAGDAARDAAWNAARDAARASAWAAAWNTAWDAARDAARARSSAWNTAWNTAWDNQNTVITDYVTDLMEAE